MAEGPRRHVALGSRLELDGEKQVPRASSEVDLPQHVGLGADQAGGGLFGGQILGPLEVQLAGEVVVDEAADHVLDGQRQGEEELVGLVVSAGQRGSPAVVGSGGAGGSDSWRGGMAAVALMFAPVPGRWYGGMGLLDSGFRQPPRTDLRKSGRRRPCVGEQRFPSFVQPFRNQPVSLGGELHQGQHSPRKGLELSEDVALGMRPSGRRLVMGQGG